VKIWLRILVTVALCTLLLVYVVDVREVAATLRRCDPWWALVAIGALTADRVLMSYKWGLLLTIRGYSVTLANKLMVYCSAMMWGLALPSTVGADGIRVMLVRRFGVRVDDCLATILVERGVGFVSALATALVGLLILQGVLPDASIYDAALGFGLFALAAAIGVLVFSFSSGAPDAVLKLLPRRAAASKLGQLIKQLHDAYRSLAVDRRRLWIFAALTFLEQMLMVACYGLTAKALGVEFSALFLFAAVPLALLISRLPVSLDGIGVYEAIFMAVMTLGGVRPEDSLAISLAARALQIVVWLPWWLALMGYTGVIRPSDASATTSSR
jgi:glycosyltransferase 2 family protein